MSKKNIIDSLKDAANLRYTQEYTRGIHDEDVRELYRRISEMAKFYLENKGVFEASDLEIFANVCELSNSIKRHLNEVHSSIQELNLLRTLIDDQENMLKALYGYMPTDIPDIVSDEVLLDYYGTVTGNLQFLAMLYPLTEYKLDYVDKSSEVKSLVVRLGSQVTQYLSNLRKTLKNINNLNNPERLNIMEYLRDADKVLQCCRIMLSGGEKKYFDLAYETAYKIEKEYLERAKSLK